MSAVVDRSLSPSARRAWIPVASAIALISAVSVWELIQTDSAGDSHVRPIIELAAVVLLAGGLFIREWLTVRHLSTDVRLADERLRLALECGEAVAWDRDVRTDRNVWSGDLQTVFGIPGDTHEGRLEDFIRCVHPDDRRRVADAIAAAQTRRTIYRATFRVVRADEIIRWVASIGRFYYSAAGEPVRMLGIAVDISDRKKIEDELYESQERFAAILASCNDSVISVDPGGTITSWNPAAERLYGYTAAEAIGRSIQMLVPPDLVEETAHLLDRLKRGERIEHFDTIRVTSDGARIRVALALAPMQDADGRFVGVSLIAHARSAAEEALRESEERFRLVANTAPVMIWMAGVDKLCTYFNRTWLEFTGRPLESELGNGWTELVHRDDFQRCMDTYVHAFDHRESFRMEYRLRRHDGEFRWMLDTGVPRFTPDGSFSGYIGSAIDVTDHKHAEEVLSSLNRRLMEAHEEERALIARELHDDIGQRMALLAIELDRLRHDMTEQRGDTRDLVADLHAQTNSLGKDIQAMSHRLHSSKLDYLGIVPAAAAFCREMSDQQHVQIDFRTEGVPGEVAKETALGVYRVLQEAVSNAVKHAGASKVSVTLIGRPDEMTLEVVDQGVGFDTSIATSGQGLGLTSMKERLRLVKGEMSIESGPGAGTTVRARVPLQHTANEIAAAG